MAPKRSKPLPIQRGEELVAEYRDFLAGARLADNTRRAYLARVRGYLAWLEASGYSRPNDEDPLADSPAHSYAVRDYLSHLRTVEKRAIETANATAAALRHFYVYFLRFEELDAGGEGIRRDEAPTALTPAEHKELVRALEHPNTSPRDRAMATLMLDAGLRVSEVAGLEVGDLTLGQRSGPSTCVRARAPTRRAWSS